MSINLPIGFLVEGKVLYADPISSRRGARNHAEAGLPVR